MNDAQLSEKIALLRLAFTGLEEAELQEMVALTQLCRYPADYVLCQEGAYEKVFYIIVDGRVIITKKISDQEGERVLRIAGKGDLVGEMSLIQNAPRSATVRTLTECSVLEMGKTDFEAMLGQSPRMALTIIRTALDRIRANDQMAIQDLQKANKVLRQLDRNKLEFIQVAAHELRTPLTVLIGYINILRSLPGVEANTTLEQVIGGINSGAGRMHEIVNTMLDVTRIDSETMKAAHIPVPLKRVVNDVVNGFMQAANERRIKLTVEHDPDIPSIQGDPTLIQKALQHLIVNAIKYTPDGGKVKVSTRPVLIDDSVPGVEITVKDTGIGLDPEQQELIFEKFYQVGDVALHSSGKTSFKGGGPGLGLAIVRGVARAHGGKVWAESAGHDELNFPGSTFYLQLPVNTDGDDEDGLPKDCPKG